jgi:hypothetical protein
MCSVALPLFHEVFGDNQREYLSGEWKLLRKTYEGENFDGAEKRGDPSMNFGSFKALERLAKGEITYHVKSDQVVPLEPMTISAKY